MDLPSAIGRSGNSVQHGTRRQLRGIQRVHERVAGWSLVAGHPRQQTHSRSKIEFARVNVPIISIAMAVGCAVLVGEVYIMRSDSPY